MMMPSSVSMVRKMLTRSERQAVTSASWLACHQADGAFETARLSAGHSSDGWSATLPVSSRNAAVLDAHDAAGVLGDVFRSG
jgi:hypothetical protein